MLIAKYPKFSICLVGLFSIVALLSSCSTPPSPVPPIAPPTPAALAPGPAKEVVASFYDDGFQGKKTASGEAYDANELTAAHRQLPFGTKVKVTDPKSGKSVNVRVNDRGPFTPGRKLDLSKRAAKEIGITHKGVGKVKMEVLSEGSDPGTAVASKARETSSGMGRAKDNQNHAEDQPATVK